MLVRFTVFGSAAMAVLRSAGLTGIKLRAVSIAAEFTAGIEEMAPVSCEFEMGVNPKAEVIAALVTDTLPAPVRSTQIWFSHP
jgi:hypothetical protein